MSLNRTLSAQMEHWTEKETPYMNKGKQSHYPTTHGGRSLIKPKKPGSSGGSKNRRRVWFEDVTVMP